MLPLMKKSGKIICVKCESEFDEDFKRKAFNVPQKSKEQTSKPAMLQTKDQSKQKEISGETNRPRPPVRSPIIQRSFKEKTLSVDEDYVENINAVKRIYTAVMLEEVMEISNHHELSNREKLALIRSLINESKLKDLF